MNLSGCHSPCIANCIKPMSCSGRSRCLIVLPLGRGPPWLTVRGLGAGVCWAVISRALSCSSVPNDRGKHKELVVPPVILYRRPYYHTDKQDAWICCAAWSASYFCFRTAENPWRWLCTISDGSHATLQVRGCALWEGMHPAVLSCQNEVCNLEQQGAVLRLLWSVLRSALILENQWPWTLILHQDHLGHRQSASWSFGVYSF